MYIFCNKWFFCLHLYKTAIQLPTHSSSIREILLHCQRAAFLVQLKIKANRGHTLLGRQHSAPIFLCLILDKYKLNPRLFWFADFSQIFGFGNHNSGLGSNLKKTCSGCKSNVWNFQYLTWDYIGICRAL